MILLDTHVLVWLYQDPVKFIPPKVRRRLDDEPSALSPFAALELQYLYEVGRIAVPSSTITDYLVPRLEMSVTDLSATAVCRAALDQDWTRDPFDRLLAAQAVATGCPLVTKDRRIRENLDLAWWTEDG